MRISLTVLCDNLVTTRRLLAEHGLSILLERGEEQLLFDTGQSNCPLHNASLLDISLRSPPIVLSHGHYDHTDGLSSFLRAFDDTIVLAHPDIFKERFSKVGAEEARSIGMSLSKDALMRRGARFHLREGPQEVLEGIWTTGYINRRFQDDQALDWFYLDPDGRTTDDIRDDTAIIVEGSRKALILFGCAHAGVRNTVLHVEAMTDKSLCGIVGGMHLLNSSKAETRALAQFLKEHRIEYVAASHCTGWNAAQVLNEHLNLTVTSVGTRLHFQL